MQGGGSWINPNGAKCASLHPHNVVSFAHLPISPLDTKAAILCKVAGSSAMAWIDYQWQNLIMGWSYSHVVLFGPAQKDVLQALPGHRAVISPTIAGVTFVASEEFASHDPQQIASF